MNKNIKIIIIGFGSIGQRHYKNLFSLGFSNIYVYDIDDIKTRKSSFATPSAKATAGKHENTKTLSEINIDILKQFDVALICNPNNAHITDTIKCAKAGCHLFIEKPLSHNFAGIEKLLEICQKKKLINIVACNMRFHPCLKFIKDYLAKNKLGKIYSIHHEFGYYLPYWRPGQDYRKNYAASKAAGGGIILDDIHEFDLLFWLNDFAKVEESKIVFGKASDLKIETEDSCIAAFKFKNKVFGSVRCDYLQQNYSRNCKVVGAKGNLEWDFNKNIVWLYAKSKSKEIFKVKNYDLNQMYIDEIKYFFACLSKKQKTFNNIKTAKEILNYCVNRK